MLVLKLFCVAFFFMFSDLHAKTLILPKESKLSRSVKVLFSMDFEAIEKIEHFPDDSLLIFIKSVLKDFSLKEDDCKNILDIIEHMVKTGAFLDVRDPAGYTPLHIACARGYLFLVKFLIELTPLIDPRTDQCETPLHLAVVSGNFEIAKFLLENGAKVDARTTQSSGSITPLLFACSNGDEKMVNLLLDNGACIEGASSKFFGLVRPIHAACSNGCHSCPDCDVSSEDAHSAVLKILIEHGADVNAQTDPENSEGVMPLHIVCISGSKDMAKLLIENGAKFEAKTASNKTPLTLACEYRQLDIAELLCSYGCPVLETDDKDLKAAMERGHSQYASSIFIVS